MEKKCEVCKTRFQSKRRDARFCSGKCRIASVRGKQKQQAIPDVNAQARSVIASRVKPVSAEDPAAWVKMAMKFAVVQWVDERCMANVPNVPGCMGTGATAQSARADLEEALQGWAEIMVNRGHGLPVCAPPASSILSRLTVKLPSEDKRGPLEPKKKAQPKGGES